MVKTFLSVGFEVGEHGRFPISRPSIRGSGSGGGIQYVDAILGEFVLGTALLGVVKKGQDDSILGQFVLYSAVLGGSVVGSTVVEDEQQLRSKAKRMARSRKSRM
jgi:hypothetical protein